MLHPEKGNVVPKCPRRSLRQVAGALHQVAKMICVWETWATTGKSSFGLRAAYADLTRILVSNPETKFGGEGLEKGMTLWAHYSVAVSIR